MRNSIDKKAICFVLTAIMLLGLMPSMSLSASAIQLPEISSISPSSGHISGGTSVKISGIKLYGASAVKFGSTSASFSINSDGQIIATAPAGSEGTVYVTVKNGDGSTSEISDSAKYTYTLIPDAPTNVIAEAGDKQATVSFTPLTYNGDATITSYTVTSHPGGLSKSGGSSPITVTGLTNGTPYTFTVTATNSVGTSAASSPSNSVSCHGPISPESADFDKNTSAAAYKDIAVTMTLSGSSLLGIRYGLTSLTSGTDYTVSGSTCTIKKEYLKTLAVGNTVLTFDFDHDNLYDLNINISDSAPSAPITYPSIPDPVVQINGRWQQAGTASTSTNASGQSVLTVALDSQRISNILSAQGSRPVITIPTTGSDVAAGVLSAELLQTMQARDAVLEVKTDNVTYTLPTNAINIASITDILGGNVSLADVAVSVQVGSPTAAQMQAVTAAALRGGFSVLAPPVDFSVSLTHQSLTAQYTNFSSYVQRSMLIPPSVSPNFVSAVVAISSDGAVRSVPFSISQSGGSNYAVISSPGNSIYALVSHSANFSDMEDHWAKSYVDVLTSRMAVSGFEDDTFRPDAAMTRAEFTAMLVKALGIETANVKNRFTDVAPAAWYCAYVNAAVGYGIVSGYENGGFRPNAYITREQAMTIVTNAMKLSGLSTDINKDDIVKTLAAFGDGSSVSDYARTAAALCVKNGIISGETDSAIAPLQKVTRAQAAAIITRLLAKSKLI